jgi:hypothetical protein
MGVTHKALCPLYNLSMRAGLLSVGIFLVALALTMPLQLETTDTAYFRLGFLLSGLVAVAGSLSGTAAVSLALCALCAFPFYGSASPPTLGNRTVFLGVLVFGGIFESMVGMGTSWAQALMMLSPESRKGFGVGLACGLLFGVGSVAVCAALGKLLTGILLFIGFPVLGALFGVFYGVVGSFLSFVGRDMFRAIVFSAIFGILVAAIASLISPAIAVGLFLLLVGFGALFGFVWERTAGPTWFVPIRAV